MAVTLADLLDAPSLGVRLVGPGDGLHRPLRWASVTELADPRPFLDGGELVLTTGLAQRTAAAQREFVARIAQRGVAGLGFGTGLRHPRVPRATIVAAAEQGLPLLEIPYATPFLAVDRFIASRVLAAHAGQGQHLLGLHDELARVVARGGDLPALLDVLRGQVGGHVAVLDPFGVAVASSPATAAWPPPPLAGAQGVRAWPLPAGGGAAGAPPAHLCLRGATRNLEVVPHAVTLVEVALEHQRLRRSGPADVLGQALDDVVRGVMDAGRGQERLARAGAVLEGPLQVVVVPVGAGQRQLAHTLLAWAVPVSAPAARIARSGDWTAVLVGGQPAGTPEGSPGGPVVPGELADVVAGRAVALTRGAGRPVAVGVGTEREGLVGLRWSFLEAQEAARHGDGVQRARPLSMTGLLRAGRDLPLAELAAEVLAPLRAADTSGGRLLETVHAYLDADGDVAAVAARLYVHRNTVRYRLRQAERVSGLSLRSTRDRAQLWLALEASGFPPRSTG